MSRALSRATGSARARRGLTLVELIVALGLLALLFGAIAQILDRTLGLWQKTETRRELVDEGAAVLELLAGDLASGEGGPRGDLVAEWIGFDTSGDGGRDTYWPRLRLVRQASRGEFARLAAGGAGGADLGLVEVAWAVLPAYAAHESAKDPALAAEGVLWRGERIAGSQGLSLFEPGAFRADGRPVAGRLNEVTGGVLWLGFAFATQSTIFPERFGGAGAESAWSIGDRLGQAGTSWDAWRRGRPDREASLWNAEPPGLAQVGERSQLPRRVRIEIELERASDRKRRTRLSAPLDPRDAAFTVDDADRLPRLVEGEGARFVKIGTEWMQLVSIADRQVVVRRAQRGTLASAHAPGALVHYGFELAREVPIEAREDWDL